MQIFFIFPLVTKIKKNNTNSYTIWDGPTITFTKADGTDPNLQGNQDRITSNI